jgi:fibrinogen beta/gamma subunit family protein
MLRRAWLLAPLTLALAASCSVINNPEDPTESGAGASSGDCDEPFDTLENCGACGVPCAPAHASGPTCDDGECSYDACGAGFDDCDGDKANGCEVDTSSDPTNCDACGADCSSAPFEHVAELTCSSGACGWEGCAQGFGDCDATEGNGCEMAVDTLTDCGDCGVPCTPDHVDVGSCVGGVCAYGDCAGSFLDCDGDTGNGCESDGAVDPRHCGDCTNACDPGAACAGGMCCATPPSCQAILASGGSVGNGLYLVDPNCGDPSDAFQTYCDMTTDGGGWTLVVNRIVNSDDLGQPDLDVPHGTFNDARTTNWNFDINLFWSAATQVVFADKENSSCASCAIANYDSAIRIDKPMAPAWSKTCSGLSTSVNSMKLVGPQAGMPGTAFTCAATLGWGACTNQVCHYGVHSMDTSSDGSWSGNTYNELHFPSAYSSYKNYGTFNGPEGQAYCRSCGGGLPPTLNLSSTCCQNSSFNAKSRWTIWVR